MEHIVNNVYSTSAYSASGVIKAKGGRLLSISGYNSKASVQYIQIFNTVAVPADTAVPVFVIAVAASSNFSINFSPASLGCMTGITWSNSSTVPTKTIDSADVFLTALFI